MKEGYVHSEKFIVYTLRVAFMLGDKKHESFDENRPVLEQMDEGYTGKYDFCYGLLSWSLQHAIRVEPKEHMNQSLKEMAAIIVKRDRLGEQEYKSYRKWVYKELRKQEMVLNENEPAQDEKDKNAYLKSKN